MDLCERRHPTSMCFSTSRIAQGLGSAHNMPSFLHILPVKVFHILACLDTCQDHGSWIHGRPVATGAPVLWLLCLSPKSIDSLGSMGSGTNAFGSGGSFCSCSSFNVWPRCAWCASVSCPRSFWRFTCKRLGLAACETKLKLFQSTIKYGPRRVSTDWLEHFLCGSKPREEWKLFGNNSQ